MPDNSVVLDVLSYLGTCTAIIQNASGFPLLRRIIQDKDCSKYTKLPMMTMTVVNCMVGLYGWFVIGRIDGVVICNAVGLAFWLINAAVYLKYTLTTRGRLIFALSYLSLMAAAVLIYPLLWYWLDDETTVNSRATVVAAIMQGFNISGFISPSRSIVIAIRERDTRRVPRTLSFVNLVNASIWTAYGVNLGDPWMIWPNMCGIIIAAAQVFVLVYLAVLTRGDVKVAAAAAVDDSTQQLKANVDESGGATTLIVVAPADGTSAKPAVDTGDTAAAAASQSTATESSRSNEDADPISVVPR